LHSADLTTPFKIGSQEIRNRVILAPMSGVTDLPFRTLAWRYGAGLVVTEMVASRELVANKGESWARLRNAGMLPHVVQLAGREPYWISEAAKIAEANGAGIIDINMGCPAKKVIGGYSGSALMRDLDLAVSIIEETVKAVKVPVTVKMRLGWDDDSRNAPELAARAEGVGAQCITVHGRTRMQFYEGTADWDAIAATRAAISIPLIANGDVKSSQDAETILEKSGADAVMVGRAAQGRPWLIGQLGGSPAPEASKIADIACEHYEMMLEFYGHEAGLRHARKHLGWYLDQNNAEISTSEKSILMTTRDSAEVLRIFHRALSTKNGVETPRDAA
jgi:tRNA-dihydrouridine synthase B